MFVGQGPPALWRADVTPDGLKDAKMLDADVGVYGLAGCTRWDWCLGRAEQGLDGAHSVRLN